MVDQGLIPAELLDQWNDTKARSQQTKFINDVVVSLGGGKYELNTQAKVVQDT